jgi:hypothetical protein
MYQRFAPTEMRFLLSDRYRGWGGEGVKIIKFIQPSAVGGCPPRLLFSLLNLKQTRHTQGGGDIRPFIQPFIQPITHRHKLGGGETKRPILTQSFTQSKRSTRSFRSVIQAIIRAVTQAVIQLVVVSRCWSGGCKVLLSM